VALCKHFFYVERRRCTFYFGIDFVGCSVYSKTWLWNSNFH